ncbi:MAG TPA: ribosome-associated translation inhibitor RaiA [Rhodospirillales bacterium]|nr:ribosome-associated translation inhibitor RaiA [Rhodospirillales bacterium]
MQVPLEIAFHNMEPSEFIEANVRERVGKLERYFDRIIRCSVSIEAPHRAHRQGNLYHVRIEISVPGKDLVVSRNPGDIHAHKDVYVAIRDAFAAAERQLADHARKPSREPTP